MRPLFAATEGASPPTELVAGAFHMPGAIPLEQQRWLVAECLALMDGAVPAYVPIVRGGGRMHVRMLCLGLHWNGQLYRYEPTRSDFDGRPVPPVPPAFAALAATCADRVGMRLAPDICIMNHYDDDGRMGLHQDKDESAASIAAGTPVVSLSLGDTARFLLGGARRRDDVRPLWLASGDAFVFGGPSRLMYHGISRVLRGTAPADLGLAGRISLTFRQY